MSSTPAVNQPIRPTWLSEELFPFESRYADVDGARVHYPGFGLSDAAPGYAYTPAEHAGVVERMILGLDLQEVTMMVQDWGGPIGFAAATRHPDRFTAARSRPPNRACPPTCSRARYSPVDRFSPRSSASCPSWAGDRP